MRFCHLSIPSFNKNRRGWLLTQVPAKRHLIVDVTRYCKTDGVILICVTRSVLRVGNVFLELNLSCPGSLARQRAGSTWAASQFANFIHSAACVNISFGGTSPELC